MKKKLMICGITTMVIVAGLLVSIGLFSQKTLADERIVSGTGTVVYITHGGKSYYGIMPDEEPSTMLVGAYLPVTVLPWEFAEDGIRVRYRIKLVASYFKPFKSATMVEILEIEREDEYTSTPQSILDFLEEKYDFIVDGSQGWKSANVNDNDTLLLHPYIKGPPPAFRADGDKIVCINYPGSYAPMNTSEFVSFIEDLKKEFIDDESINTSSSIVLEFQGDCCNPESVDPWNESQLGIKEIIWLDNSTVFIQAYVSINCAFWIEGGGFYIHNNTITLVYYVGQEGFITEKGTEFIVMADCICAAGLSYTLSNLNSTDFVFELESSSRTYYN